MILGGGFGGVYTARHLEQLCKRRPDVEIVLVSRDNFLLVTPLLFEVCSGTLDLRHCAFPVRAFLRTTRFGEGIVQSIDLERRTVRVASARRTSELAYDQLVLALGALTNQNMIPGSENAFTFKTLADALLLRNHMIERFERADEEPDAERKRALLTFVIIGGGLVGVELFGELTAFVDAITPLYAHVSRKEVRCILLQGGERIMPEMDARLADYGVRVLRGRPGADIRTHAKVRAIEPGKVHLPDETIEAETIVLAAGIVPNPVVANLPVEKDSRGHIVVEGTMRCKSHPEVWALGDCACIPDARGQAISQPGPACAARGQDAGQQHSCCARGPAAHPLRLRHAGHDGLARPQQGVRAAPTGPRPWSGGVVRAPHVLPAADAGVEPPAAHHDRLDVRAAVPGRYHQDELGQRGGAAPPRGRGRHRRAAAGHLMATMGR